MKASELRAFGCTDCQAEVVAEVLGRFGIDTLEDLSTRWATATPEGRVLLRWVLGTDEGWKWAGIDLDQHPFDPSLAMGERDILRWAFAAEMTGIGIPVEKAILLVDHGITLRDIGSTKTAGELADQRWAFVEKAVRDGSLLNLKEITCAVRGKAAAAVEKDLADYPRVARGGSPRKEIRDRIKKGLREDFVQLKRGLAKREADPERPNPFSVRFYDLLVFSDSHLAGGTIPSAEGITRLSPTEDFFYDDAFFRFLYHCEDERQKRGGYPYELVMNGDVIDFIQIVVPREKKGREKDYEYWAVPRLPDLVSGDGGDDVTGSLARRLHERLASIKVYQNSVGGWDEWTGRILGDLGLEDVEWGDVDWETAGWGNRVGPAQQDPGLGRREGSGPGGEEWEHVDWGSEEWEDVDWGTEGWWEADTVWEEHVVRKRAERAAKPPSVHAMERAVALNQLADVYMGHPRFFQGLAWFLAQGNRLVIVRGNHDPQLCWPEVQLAFVGWLHTAYRDLQRVCGTSARHTLPVPAGKLERIGFPLSPSLEARVSFDHSWFYYREGLVYVEHGGQYEFLNASRYFLDPVVSAKDADLPDGLRVPPLDDIAEIVEERPLRAADWLPALRVSPGAAELESTLGSLGIVYLVNNMEIEMPNFQRPEYKEVYRQWMLYKRPGVVLRWLGALCRVVGAWGRWLCSFVRQGRRDSYGTRQKAYARLVGMTEKCIERLDETKWVRGWRNGWAAVVYIALEIALVVVPLVLVGLGIWYAYVEWPDGFLRSVLDTVLVINSREGESTILYGLLDLVIAFVLGLAGYWVITWVRNKAGLGDDYLFEPAKRAAHILKKCGKDVPYYLFGHDHDHNAKPLGVEGERCSGCKRVLKGFDLEDVRLEAATCPECGARARVARLERKVGRNLDGWTVPDMVPCPKCGKWVERGDVEFEDVECEHCGHELLAEDVDSEALWRRRRPDEDVAMPEAWASLEAFSLIESVAPPCEHARTDPAVKLIPPHVVSNCPDCKTTERQWLGVWSLRCPECGRKARKRDVRLVEDRAILHCPKCNRAYSEVAPADRWYLNTGTWLDWFAKERKRLVRRDLEFAFVRMIDTHRVLSVDAGDDGPARKANRPDVQLLRWNDAARRVEPCETFRAIDEKKGATWKQLGEVQ